MKKTFGYAALGAWGMDPAAAGRPRTRLPLQLQCVSRNRSVAGLLRGTLGDWPN